MTAILGISAFYHDSAAALVIDGRIVAAAQEERFSRIKHDAAFPAQAAAWCLSEAGISQDQLDYVAFYDKPLVKFERLLETYIAFAPRGLQSFSRAIPVWLKKKLNTRAAIREGLGRSELRTPLVFMEHHESHAASAFFPSPFEQAAVLTLDGVGEWCTSSLGVGSGNTLRLIDQLMFPHSLGLLYSAFTYYCGFKVNSGEYKLMGLAPYGTPVYRELILQRLIDLKPDGSFWLDMAYFNYAAGLTMTGPRFHALFGGPPRPPESSLEQRHMDLAASIQAVTEEVLLRQARYAQARTGMRNLVMAGGVALNCVANGRLLREGPFESIWIQPAAGDAGGALGAALFVEHQLLGKPRTLQVPDAQGGSFLGPRFDPGELERLLIARNMPYQRFDTPETLDDEVVGLLEAGKIVGLFQGRMEFGPRALGARSILGDARSPAMQATMNRKIKFRESFRPFAPMVLREHAHAWFGIDPAHESPYMLLVAPVLERHRTPVDPMAQQVIAVDPDLRRRVNVVRSAVPAVTHVDYSARLQTVDAGRNPVLHRLLTRFHARTGCPMLVNTSFNVRGEPLVCRPEEALQCFEATEMDVLVLENLVVRKDRLDAASLQQARSARARYLERFELD